MKVISAIYELIKLPHNIPYKAVLKVGYLEPLERLAKPDWLHHIIYTDEYTYNKYDLQRYIAPNIEFKFFDLNQSEYKGKFSLIRNQYDLSNPNMQLERVVSVTNYAELMYHKFNFVHGNVTSDDELIVWMDCGLFQNSCGHAWKPWIYEHCSKLEFMEKLREYFLNKDFVALQARSEGYAFAQFSQVHQSAIDPKSFTNRIIAGGLWGGRGKAVKEMTAKFMENVHILLNNKVIVTDQECMAMEFMENPDLFHIEEFEHWNDLQRVFLKIYGKLDDNYRWDLCVVNSLR